MPAQKRLYEAEEDDPLQSIRNNYHYEQGEDGDDSDRNHSPGSVDKDEFVIVKLAEVRKEVQCPICLGIIRKTRTVMECLHRFCRECIDKSMRLGNNECPACRTHCASRRSLRDDPNYDALIAALYPDIDRYETDELTFHEEEKARNKQIQASIAETIRRQSEALGRKRTTAKVSGAAFMKRPEGSYSSARTRGRRNYQAAELHGSDDDEDTVAHDDVKDSSSEEGIEVKPKRCKRLESARASQPSARASTPNECRDENEAEANRDFMGASAGFVGTAEVLAWGKGGMRSHTRHGAASGGNSKNARNTSLSKFVDYFKNLEDKNYEMDVHLMLISFDDQAPTLERPYLCCRPTLSVRHLRQYVAHQTALQADEIEILAAGEHYPELNLNPSTHVPISLASIVDKSKDAFRILGEQETLAGLEAFNLSRGHLLLAYRKK